ncbi:MAG: baseplate J/gp47 family protein [Oscillospiraceae bacterium]|nr:baseplate J/gp47 family protein [Oscillospiraceae bacterium]
MFENMTYEFILAKMLGSIPDDADKREGGFIFDALAPCALELANFYAALSGVLDESFADSAGREMLIRRAAERGIVPYRATFAVVRGEFNADVPLGARFSLDELRYRVIEKSGGGSYKLECESVGTVGNRAAGVLIPVDYINGLTLARVTELLIPGDDDESAEDLRKRYFGSLSVQSFGGNISDYKRFTEKIPGVGSVKVEPAFNGGGTVKLTVINSQFAKPSDELVRLVQDEIDPPDNSGVGAGLAPVGHSVTVEGVDNFVVNIVTSMTFGADWSWGDVAGSVSEAVDGYLYDLAHSWADEDSLIVRISQIETRLLGIAGVIDVQNTSLNGAARNLVIPPNRIPVRGSVVNG